MSTGPTYKVKFRRRRESKTNYAKRLALIKSHKPRLVVRKTSNSTVCEVMLYNPKGDETKSFFTSRDLKKYGWTGHTGNVPAAYLTGYVCARKAVKAGLTEAVLDIGLVTPVHGTRVFSALKGAIDAGMKIPASETVFPKADRIKGKHISEEAVKNFDETMQKIKKEFGE